MSDTFYRAFEDRHRGSRELILSRLRVYLPFVEPLKALYDDCVAVDLGCGRGEWLELMGEVGIDARGIDLDDGMLAACVERGLAAEQGEAIAYLEALPDESVAIVSGFHVAEHIPFEALQQLVQEALRVLRPAGLLILETPNPENLSVGACKFYYDPTHQRPIPPPLLSFLPEHYGYARTKVLRLQEAPGLMDAEGGGLSEVLLGVSPDYAVVAQKGSETPGDLARFEEVFATESGVNLDTLAARYDARMAGRLAELSQTQGQLSQTQGQLSQTQGQLSQTQGQLSHTQEQLSQTQGQLSHTQEQLSQTQGQLSHTQVELSQTQGQLTHTQEQLAAVYASTSWRVTAPIRGAARGLRKASSLNRQGLLRLKVWLKPHAVRAVTHPSSKRLIERTGRWVIAHPRLSDPIRSFVRRHERLRSRLRWLVLGQPAPRPFEPPKPVLPVDRTNAERRERQPLTGAASDIDELMLRIEDELVRWSSTAR